jgi:hypothetical protein
MAMNNSTFIITELRKKYEQIKDSFDSKDNGKVVLLLETGKVLIFSSPADATKYRIDNSNVTAIMRYIGGEPEIIGPLSP